MDKINCFAYVQKDGKGCCNALREIDCVKCKFFKTAEQIKAEERKNGDRIFSLVEWMAADILAKYYHGRIPKEWS